MLQTVPMRTAPRGPARPRWERVGLLLGLALSLGFAARVPAATTWAVCASGCTYIEPAGDCPASTRFDVAVAGSTGATDIQACINGQVIRGA